MAVQKYKKSKSKSRKRRAENNKLRLPELRPCPNCNELSLPHRVCPKCGFYKDRIVISIS